MPVAYDLSALAAALKKITGDNGVARELYLAIYRCISADSEVGDLYLAKFQLDLLVRLFAEGTTLDAAQLADHEPKMHAAFLAAVVIYCRVTDVWTDNRSPGNYSGDLPVDLKTDHYLVSKYRNNGLAHYGPGDDDAPLNTTLLALVCYEDGYEELRYPYKTANYIGAVILALQRLLPVVFELAHQRKSNLEQNLWKLIERAMVRSPHLMDLLGAHRFDPNNFYSTAQHAANFWARGHGTNTLVQYPSHPFNADENGVVPPLPPAVSEAIDAIPSSES